MQHLEWLAYDRLRSFEEQLIAIASSEFIHDSTRTALEEVKSETTRLRDLTAEMVTVSDPSFLRQHVITINQKIFNLTNYLGVLLRSTNLRNCFEAYFALNEM